MNDLESIPAVLQQRQQLMEIVRGYRPAQILFACLELDLFEAIAAGARSAPDIATAIQADARGAELLLNAAAAIGLLDKRDGRFFNTPIAETCLTRDEWTHWLIEAGFAPPRSISLPAWVGSELIVAEKPHIP